MSSTLIFARNNNNNAEQKTSLLHDSDNYGADHYNQDCYSDEDVFADENAGDNTSATKPLMHPRDRSKVKTRRPPCRCRYMVRPICCFLLLVSSLGSLMALILYFIGSFNEAAPKTIKGHNWGKEQVQEPSEPFLSDTNLVGCSKMSVEDVWVVGVPKLTTESSIRLVDVNQDGELDVILGFGTGADGRDVPNVVCKIYFNGSIPCFGGVMALEGRSGKELWRHYTPHEVYGLNCNADLNKDGVADCLAGGRAGVFQAISGKDGSLIWNFGKQDAKNGIMNLYTAQLIRDLDGDGVLDVLAIHGGDPLQPAGSPRRLSGRIVIFSGQTGKVLRWVGVPDKRESYYSPQVYLLPGGKEMVLFGTGGETHPGALWRISLSDLYAGKIERAQRICGDDAKGVMTPPVLLDLTGDGVSDIVLPLFNSTVLAIDGHSLAILWNHSFPESESYNTPAAGYYNNDDVPDFMVKYAHGPGFPIYYYSQTTILDGRTGKSLITPPIRDTMGAISSPLTVSMEGQGNDLFLYWIADCLQHEGQGVEYSFEKGTDIHKQSRADFCRLAFKTKGFAKLYVTSQHIKTPGTVVYFSEERDKEEHKAWVNTTAEAIEFVSRHPEYLENYLYYNSLATDSQRSRYDPVTRQRLINEFGPLNQQTNNFYDELKGTPMSTEAKKGKFLHHRKTTPKLLPNYYKNYKNQDPGRGLGRGGGYSLNEAPTHMSNGRIGVNNRESVHDGYVEGVSGVNYDGTNPAQYDDIYDDGGGTGSYPSRDYSQNSQDYSLYPYSQNGQAPSGDRMVDARTDADDEGDMSSEEVGGGNLPKYNNPTNIRGQSRPYEYGRMRLKRIENASRRLYGNHKPKMKYALPYGVDEDINSAESSLAVGGPEEKAERFVEDFANEDEPMPRAFMRKKRAPARRRTMGRDSGKRRKSTRKRMTKTTVLASSSNRARMAAGLYRQERKAKRKRRRKNRKRKPRGNLPEFMKKRVRRHIGPHDAKGLTRLISTGTLAPSTLSANHPDRKYSIDIVFATYWFFPADTRVILPEDKKCIEQKMAKQKIRFNRKSKYFGMDSDAYEHAATNECLNAHGDQSKKTPSHHNYNPFYLPMGQMTIYRLRLKCACVESEDIKSGKKRCARTLPFEEQQWPAYMGPNGDSHWLPRPQAQQPTVTPGKKS